MEAVTVYGDEDGVRITEIGEAMMEFPVSVRCAKMLLSAEQGNCLPFALAVVALLSVESLQLAPHEMDAKIRDAMAKNNEIGDSINGEIVKKGAQENDKDREKRFRKVRREAVTRARRQFAERSSDLLSLLNILGAFQCCASEAARDEFCKAHFVRRKNILECTSLMRQLQRTVH